MASVCSPPCAAANAITSLWKDVGLLRVDLAPLSEDAAGDVARQLLGGPVERATRRWLWEASAGNPLFLRELVRSGTEIGGLAQEGGHWRRTKAIPPPTRLLDLLDALGALEATQALESRGLLAAAETSVVPALRAGHPLYGEALRASLKVTERAGLHREPAGHLDPADESARLRLAIWALDERRPSAGTEFATAAEEALAAFDPELAIRLGRAALGVAPGIEAALPLDACSPARSRGDAATLLDSLALN
jgi:hypothetical protein